MWGWTGWCVTAGWRESGLDVVVVVQALAPLSGRPFKDESSPSWDMKLYGGKSLLLDMIVNWAKDKRSWEASRVSCGRSCLVALMRSSISPPSPVTDHDGNNAIANRLAAALQLEALKSPAIGRVTAQFRLKPHKRTSHLSSITCLYLHRPLSTGENLTPTLVLPLSTPTELFHEGKGLGGWAECLSAVTAANRRSIRQRSVGEVDRIWGK